MCSSLITLLTHLSPVFWSFWGLGIALKDEPILPEHKNFLLALIALVIWFDPLIKLKIEPIIHILLWRFYMQASAPKMASHGCKSWRLTGTKKGQKTGC
jgi:hypothetical protein